MADSDNEAIEDLPEEKKKGGGSSWMPVIVVVVLLPVISIVMMEFYFLPKIQSVASGAGHGDDQHETLPTIQSGGPGAPISSGGGGHGGGHGGGGETAEGEHVIQMYHFDTMKTNLANPSTTLIIVKFSIQGSDPHFLATIDQYQVQLTDATLKVLSLLTRIDTQSPGIQNVVKNDLIARFNQVLGRNLVEDLFFTDFVTQ